LVAGARGDGITGLGGRRAAVDGAAGRGGPSSIGLAYAAGGRTRITRGAGDCACGAVVGRARSNGISGLGRGSPAVTVRARGGTWSVRVHVKACRARARVARAWWGHIGAGTRGVSGGAAAARARVVGAAGLVHTHQIGGDITGVTGASKPSTGRSHIDALAVAAAGIVETTVDVDARADRVKVTRVTQTRIAIERS
jgi:hypothetical protein